MAAAAGVRHRPGPGAIVAVVGVLLFLIAVAGLPWGTANGADVNRSDIQDAYQQAVDADLEEVDFVGEYAKWIWIAAVLLLVVAAVFSTLVVPSNKGVRIGLGFLMGGVLGLAVNAIDDDGTFGPRVTAALVTVCVAALHALTLFLFFEDNDGLDPGFGVWVAVAGLLMTFVGCVMGTQVERPAPTAATAPAPGPYGYR